MTNAGYRVEDDHGASAWLPGSFVRVLLSGADTGGRCVLMQASVVKGNEPPRHIHTGEDEIVYVLEGNVEFRVGDARVAMPAGAVIVLPCGIEHSFLLNSDRAKLLLMLFPAGSNNGIGELNEVVSQLYMRSLACENSPIEQLVTIAARYGVEITGPP